MSLKENNILQEQVKGLIQKRDLWERMSPCAVPALLVLKKYGSWKMCVDNRMTNKIITKYWFPIPWIDDIFDLLFEVKIFSKIDLTTRYLQARIRAKDE